MVQEAETPVIELELVSCGTCDTVFISSERRQTCPACGGEAVGPYLEFIVTPEGPRLKNGAVAIARAEAPPAEPPTEAAGEVHAAEVEQAQVEVEQEAPAYTEVFAAGVHSFLLGGGIAEVELEDWLERMGADPETATTTVGRLAAVRETVEGLRPAVAEAQEEAAAEEPPAAAPDPAAGEEPPASA